MSRENHRVYYPDLRWRGTRSVGCLKPLSSREVLPIAASLSGRDHLLQQDRPLDRGCEHIAPCVRYEPAVPLEQVEHSLDDRPIEDRGARDRKSTRLNSSHTVISYAVFCLKKKKKTNRTTQTKTT